jgi:hypothetical protein
MDTNTVIEKKEKNANLCRHEKDDAEAVADRELVGA